MHSIINTFFKNNCELVFAHTEAVNGFICKLPSDEADMIPAADYIFDLVLCCFKNDNVGVREEKIARMDIYNLYILFNDLLRQMTLKLRGQRFASASFNTAALLHSLDDYLPSIDPANIEIKNINDFFKVYFEKKLAAPSDFYKLCFNILKLFNISTGEFIEKIRKPDEPEEGDWIIFVAKEGASKYRVISVDNKNIKVRSFGGGEQIITINVYLQHNVIYFSKSVSETYIDELLSKNVIFMIDFANFDGNNESIEVDRPDLKEMMRECPEAYDFRFKVYQDECLKNLDLESSDSND